MFFSSIYPLTYLDIFLFVYPSILPTIYLSIYLFTHLSIYLSNYLGVGVSLVRDSSTLMVGQYFKRKRELVEVSVKNLDLAGLVTPPLIAFFCTLYIRPQSPQNLT